MAVPISHGFVLPERNFSSWLEAVKPYMAAFERVAVIRSPGGNDLNRFRNITAVQAPGVWHNDDAVAHIRRAYPMVVLIDVINVATPAQLQAVLQARINAKDRFGQQISGGAHIHRRFVLEWPTNARPGRIVKTFSRDPQNRYEGVDIQTYTGAEIYAGADGVIGQVLQSPAGVSVDVISTVENQQYVTRFLGVRDVVVRPQQTVKAEDRIALAAGEIVKITIQSPGNGMDGFAIPDVIDPTLVIYWQGIRLRPTVSALRVRDAPGTFGNILGTITPADAVETEEPHGRTLAKLGVDGKWLRIRRAGSNEAHTAAWFLESFSIYDPPEAIPGVAVPGMNLDIDHPLGAPAAAPLRNLGWIRLKFNVSYDPRKHGDARYGNTDVDYTFSRYQPHIKRYADVGIKTILILTHQTFGEGQGYVWPQMDSAKWRDLAGKFADIARRVAARFAGTGQVLAYQIWNEQDTKPEHARAAVPMPATDYAYLLTQTIRAIRSVDATTPCITGGHVTGPSQGTDYARRTLAAMPADVRPTGIAFHPYGRGPEGHIFSPFGSVADEIRAYRAVLPARPVWITEWGVLDRQFQPEYTPEVTTYADGFLKIIRTQFPGQVACATWYAWADTMDNGFGLVNQNGQPKQPLYDLYLA